MKTLIIELVTIVAVGLVWYWVESSLSHDSRILLLLVCFYYFFLKPRGSAEQ